MHRRHALAAALLCAACTAETGSLDVAVSGNGTTDPAPGRYEHSIGATIHVAARPASPSIFTGWTGAASGTATTVSVVVQGHTSLTAHFGEASNSSSSSGGQSGSGSGGPSSGSGGPSSGSGGSSSGSGGSSSSSGASSSSSGGDAPTLRQAAAVLDGFALLKPCNGWSFSHQNNAGDCCCEETAASENQHITKQFGGDPSVTYLVKLRVAGVAERYWHSGGALDQPSKIFYTGGLPTIHSTVAPNGNLRPGQGACKIHPPETDNQFALPFSVPAEIRPSDGCYNGFNIFALTVSSPKQSYYLNDTTDFDGSDRQPHAVYRIDYTVTIPISGQARLDFYTIDGDHHQVTNNGTMTVPGVKTAQPYNGNFLELTVVDVATQ